MILCRLGFHRWPRMHAQWREIAIAPSTANCIRCGTELHSVWRQNYPEDGSRCTDGKCAQHRAVPSTR
jgi:hypothetical protein